MQSRFKRPTGFGFGKNSSVHSQGTLFCASSRSNRVGSESPQTRNSSLCSTIRSKNSRASFLRLVVPRVTWTMAWPKGSYFSISRTTHGWGGSAGTVGLCRCGIRHQITPLIFGSVDNGCHRAMVAWQYHDFCLCAKDCACAAHSRRRATARSCSQTNWSRVISAG